MQLTDEQIYAKDAHDYLPVFARYQNRSEEQHV